MRYTSLSLEEDCTLERLTENHDLSTFHCIEPDLNDFLKNDAIGYSNSLMGVTYLFTLKDDTSKIVCFFTVSNDVLNVEVTPQKNKINRSIPNSKRSLDHYPSVKIGRLGINSCFGKLGIGEQLMTFIKDWFYYSNKTGCRYIIVDAYNKDKVIKYYKDNYFAFLFDKEEDEIVSSGDPDPVLKTRFMFFDLKRHPKLSIKTSSVLLDPKNN